MVTQAAHRPRAHHVAAQRVLAGLHHPAHCAVEQPADGAVLAAMARPRARQAHAGAAVAAGENAHCWNAVGKRRVVGGRACTAQRAVADHARGQALAAKVGAVVALVEDAAGANAVQPAVGARGAAMAVGSGRCGCGSHGRLDAVVGIRGSSGAQVLFSVSIFCGEMKRCCFAIDCRNGRVIVDAVIVE